MASSSCGILSRGRSAPRGFLYYDTWSRGESIQPGRPGNQGNPRKTERSCTICRLCRGNHDVKTSAIFFPFDLFGSGGTRAGAELLADGFREMLADNRREKVPTRARAYAGKVRVSEFTFDRLDDYHGSRTTAREAVRKAMERRDFLIWV